MVEFTAVLEKFGKMGEKTGWWYIQIPDEIAAQIAPGVRKSFRIKGFVDKYPVKQLALMPMGDGDFILALNAEIRKKTGRRLGEVYHLAFEKDDSEIEISADLLACLEDDAEAKANFEALPKSQRNYFSKWIESAKTYETKAKRIALSVDALAKKWDYGTMIRNNKAKKIE